MYCLEIKCGTFPFHVHMQDLRTTYILILLCAAFIIIIKMLLYEMCSFNRNNLHLNVTFGLNFENVFKTVANSYIPLIVMSYTPQLCEVETFL